MKTIPSVAALAALAAFAAAGCRDLPPEPAPGRAAASACSATPTLDYFGGPVIQSAKVYEVSWGPGVSTAITGALPAFYAAIVASPYVDWLAEYGTVGRDGVMDGQPGSSQGIARGSFAGHVAITPAVCAGTDPCTVTDAQVQAELAAHFAAGDLPAPSVGCDGQNDAVYMIDFPANVTVQKRANLSTCAQLCYYHGTGSAGGKSFPYAVLPDLSAPGCRGVCGSNAAAIDNQTVIASRALVEAVTDPDIDLVTSGFARPLGWYDSSCGEIGGICDGLQGTIAIGGTTYTVQRQWSNAAGDCIVEKSALPPICTGAATPAGCRPCSCADDVAPDAGAAAPVACGAATPRCETDATSVEHGTCVAATSGPDGGADAGGGAGGGAIAASGGSGGTAGAGGGGGSAGGAGSSSGCHCAAGGAGETRALAPALLALAAVFVRRRRRSL
jgi:MYXO-CTERM domain-containing protein